MTIPKILKVLEPCTGRFPMNAMRAAVEQREAITPELLRVLETAAKNPVKFAEQKGYMLHLFAMYLLAQFREKRAYRPCVKMFSATGGTSFDLAGDTVTERLKRIFGSVYDGDPGPLRALVEDDNDNEYVRCAALDAFIVLAESGQMSREELMAYYRSLFQGRLKRTFSYTWTGLVSSVADLPPPELLEEVRQAFAEGLVDGGVSDLEWIERRLRHLEPRHRHEYALITDAIAEMEWWASFQHGERPTKRSGPAPAATASTLESLPPARQPKIGRNAPCPCSRGRKYKKCCGKG